MVSHPAGRPPVPVSARRTAAPRHPAPATRHGTDRRGRAARRARRDEGSTRAPATRERLLAAAAREFAARGFAGANVDRIAGAAGVNKAMLYYHFASKAALYLEIVGGMFEAIAARVRTIPASPAAPDEKVAAFVEAIAAEAEARPHFPPIWFREIAEGGVHLDDATIGEMAGILRTLVQILDEGVRAGRFRPVHPLLVHGGIVGPVLLFFASERLRTRLARAGVKGAGRFSRKEVVAHVQRLTLGFLRGAV
jgi:AcrR family transcriptional regulator